MTKKNIIYIAAAAMLLTACSSDEPGTLSHPASASFTAQIGNTATRAAGTQWGAGDAIGISGVSGTKTYTNLPFVTASGDGRFAPTGDAIFYQTTEPVTFTAYYPYNADGGVIEGSTSDQTAQPSFDFLWAQASGSYDSPAVNFNFDHKMSLITLSFVNGNDVNLSSLTYTVDGLAAEGTFDTATGEAAATGSAATLTAPVTADHKSLLILFPQTAESVTLTANVEGQQYVCGLSLTELKSGYRYSYTINVKKSGLSVTGCTINPWLDGGISDSDVTMPIPPLGDKASENVAVGDYYMSDGTFLDKAATLSHRQKMGCIGIVFYMGHHENDHSDYSATGIGQAKCHGYVVARQNASAGIGIWGARKTMVGCVPTDADGNSLNNIENPDIDWNGYAWTQKIISTAGGKNMLNATDPTGYPPTYYAAVDYQNQSAAPANTSGWFLPAVGQMRNISQNRESLLSGNVAAEALIEGREYWTSSEYYEAPWDAVFVSTFDGSVWFASKELNFPFFVRPILAF